MCALSSLRPAVRSFPPRRSSDLSARERLASGGSLTEAAAREGPASAGFGGFLPNFCAEARGGGTWTAWRSTRGQGPRGDGKSTRLNAGHTGRTYARYAATNTAG